MPRTTLTLRPGITNPSLWFPQRPPRGEWDAIRNQVLKRDNYTCAFCGHGAFKWMNIHHLSDSGSCDPALLAPCCVACHAVLHIGFSMMNETIEIWSSTLSQVEIVQLTRKGIIKGQTLNEIKDILPLTRGPHAPDSLDYPNNLIATMGKSPRAYLPEPLCAVFVDLARWQIEE